MEMVAPAGPMYQAGTLSGNPLAMVAGMTTLKAINKPGVFERLGQVTAALCRGFAEIAQEAGIPLQVGSAGSMWGFFFADTPVSNYAEAKTADTARYARFFHAMLDRGVYLAPSQFEAAFISLAHTDEIVNRTIEAAAEVFAGMRTEN
jgi:glutamate-1-semialdehyde 2,1-aminomutase